MVKFRPDVVALFPPDTLDAEMEMHVEYWVLYEGPQTDVEWVIAALQARPGIWTARLCRAMHNRSEVVREIIHCGQCREYANPRKRKRAASMPPNVLPGFEEIGGAYTLSEPCSKHGLTWLRHLLYRLRDAGRLEMCRERIVDYRQARGWDWVTRLYWKE